MKITIKKAPPYYTNHTTTAVWCNNPDCKENPEFFNERETYHIGRMAIKEGTTIAELDFNEGAIQDRVVYFCYDCIDVFFKEVRKTMDKSLWVFH